MKFKEAYSNLGQFSKGLLVIPSNLERSREDEI